MEKSKKLIRKTYLLAVHNSVGCKTFRNLFIEQNGKVTDATQNGRLSCAFFVSGILKMFNYIKSIHGTVANTILDLVDSGWVKVDKPKPGDVTVWEAADFGDGDIHKHIGFYVGKNLAISNNFKKGIPEKHNWQFNGSRKIEAIYRCNKEVDKD